VLKLARQQIPAPGRFATPGFTHIASWTQGYGIKCFPFWRIALLSQYSLHIDNKGAMIYGTHQPFKY
jgi:hypothetical protein